MSGFSKEQHPKPSPSRPIAPLFTLHTGNEIDKSSPNIGNTCAVSSICFVRGASSEHNRIEYEKAENRLNDDSSDSDSESDTDSDSDDGELRCSRILLGVNAELKQKQGDLISSEATATAASVALSGALLASCHVNGDALIWDLSTRRVVCNFGSPSHRGAGLALRRLGGDGTGNDHHFFYQTRGGGGIVSVHDLGSCAEPLQGLIHPSSSQPFVRSILEIETNSRTFCAAAPCIGNPNLLALPSIREAWTTLRDIRVNPSDRPVAVIHGAGLAVGGGWRELSDAEERKHGMLTSLAMVSSSDCPRPVLGCGMESGSVFFHDLAMVGKHLSQVGDTKTADLFGDHVPPLCCNVKLGRDPVLSLDLTLSENASNENIGKNENSQNVRSVVAVAGCAGDAADLCELPEEDRGTVSIIKASIKDRITSEESLDSDDDRQSNSKKVRISNSTMKARLRARVPTCEVSEHSAGGKPGVATCRFRPDGRVFAVGGWDKRLRIFGRADGKRLAILKGHTDSVTAFDWTADAATSGILATGSGDGRISIWRAFPHTKKPDS